MKWIPRFRRLRNTKPAVSGNQLSQQAHSMQGQGPPSREMRLGGNSAGVQRTNKRQPSPARSRDHAYPPLAVLEPGINMDINGRLLRVGQAIEFRPDYGVAQHLHGRYILSGEAKNHAGAVLGNQIECRAAAACRSPQNPGAQYNPGTGRKQMMQILGVRKPHFNRMRRTRNEWDDHSREFDRLPLFGH